VAVSCYGVDGACLDISRTIGLLQDGVEAERWGCVAQCDGRLVGMGECGPLLSPGLQCSALGSFAGPCDGGVYDGCT
jgi:hypothetical protein